mgnify:CR=1 FL=1
MPPQSGRLAGSKLSLTRILTDRIRNTLRAVRNCLQTGTPSGNDRLRAQIERTLGVKVGYSSLGRPKTKPAARIKREEGQLDLRCLIRVLTLLYFLPGTSPSMA